eukprot:TRINITY_DN3994_c0_g1_i1.p2 TRINITY_DN3994_c0_g1~~TRINITY_DN3994_c0_g1_i1.p2  ORF type:complete len:129 (-),score=24.28 TRINITY_DN3994_c0_g1_i1:108-494(-)
MLRVGVGSSVQLSTYDTMKQIVMSMGIVKDGTQTHLLASMFSGVMLVIAMNPVDVISTRLYNQPVENGKGVLYNGLVDCFSKTVRSEGLRGLYKGTLAHYFRVGPHTVFTFLFWEKFKELGKYIREDY